MKNDEIINAIQNLKGKTINIRQEGFLETQFSVKDIIYDVIDDILKIEGNNEDNFIALNLNLVYKMDQTKDEIVLFIDNDTVIKIREKKWKTKLLQFEEKNCKSFVSNYVF